METTRDSFLGGRLTVLQPAEGYRAGADPVFLAASLSAGAGETVLDLGCGVGVAMLCAKARIPDLRIIGVDLQPELIDLARQNLAANGIDGDVFVGDAAAFPEPIRTQSYDHVITNPPFFPKRSGSNALAKSRELGRRETIALSDWVDVALRRLKPGGTFTLINRIERLPETLAASESRLGDLRLLPLVARRGRPAKLFILQGRKGAKGAFSLRPPLILHTGSAHEKDGDSYTEEAQAVLRQGQPLLVGG